MRIPHCETQLYKHCLIEVLRLSLWRNTDAFPGSSWLCLVSSRSNGQRLKMPRRHYESRNVGLTKHLAGGSVGHQLDRH
jgi:hypothetical protein